MYAKPVVATAVPTVAAATILPNTGSSWVISAAIAVGVGMLTWGVIYARSSR
jgi:LPXTG-motif cell wall-anchored protein